jgi:hypothetical protein
MKWVLIASIVVAATFVCTFYYTGSTWTATNAAGIVSMLYILGVLYRVTRPPVSAKHRRWTWGIAAYVLAGTTFYWTLMYSTTNWQYGLLHMIHKVIVHGVSMDLLRTRGVKIMSAYAAQSMPTKVPIGEVFRRETTYVNPDSSIIEVGGDDQFRLFAASVSDTQVVLVCQSIVRVDGEDRVFRNFDGRIGMTQDRLVLSKRGMVYEIQN